MEKKREGGKSEGGEEKSEGDVCMTLTIDPERYYGNDGHWYNQQRDPQKKKNVNLIK